MFHKKRKSVCFTKNSQTLSSGQFKRMQVLHVMCYLSNFTTNGVLVDDELTERPSVLRATCGWNNSVWEPEKKDEINSNKG